MSFEQILERLSQSGRYLPEIEGEVLRVESLDSGSQYIVEEFSTSFQVRQAILFDCAAAEDLELADLYVLCSMVNERFSGCKCFIDQWSVLVNAFDLITVEDPAQMIETALDQVEFVSQVLVELIEDLRTSNQIPSHVQIEAAFNVPPLQ